MTLKQRRMGVPLSKPDTPLANTRSTGNKTAAKTFAKHPAQMRAKNACSKPTAARHGANLNQTLMLTSRSPTAAAGGGTGPSRVCATPAVLSVSTEAEMARGKLDGVASFKGILAQGSQATDDATSARNKTKTEKPFDVRASNDDSDSDDDDNSDDSDDEKGPSADLFARLNKTMTKPTATSSSARNGIPPSHRAPRGKEDEIADSDAERDAAAAKAKAFSKAVIKTEPSPATSEAGSDDDSSEGGGKGVKLKKAASTSSDSSSDADPSDSSDDSDSDAKRKETLPSKNKTASTKARAAASTSSDSDSSDKEPAATQKPVSAPKDAESGSDSSSSDAASDEDSSDSKSDSENEPGASALTPARKTSKGAAAPSQSFSGMEIRRVDDSVSVKSLSDFLANTKSKGQQAWVFSIPITTTVKVVEKLDFTPDVAPAVRASKKDRKTKGGDAAANASYKILLSNRPADSQPDTPTAQILRIQHSYDLSGLATAPPLSSRPPRPQPKGMHPRFRPLGVPPTEPMGDIGPSDDEEQEDVEMTQAPLVVPVKKSKSEKKSKKRQDGETASEVASASKKSTKRKHQADDQDLASSQQVQEEEPQKKKKVKKQKQDDGATPVSKATPILPPSVPASSQKRRMSEANLDAATPAPKSSKKNVSFSGRAAKESPVPVPFTGQRTAVPLPDTSAPAAVAETPKTSKKDKKKRSSDVLPSSQASAPTLRETPVPAPTLKASKSKK